MTAFSRTARLVLVAFVCIVAAWVALVIGVYRFRVDQIETVRPPVARIFNMVELLERAPPKERDLIVDIVSGPLFSVRLIGVTDDPWVSLAPEVDEDISQDYKTALGDRAVTLTAPPTALLARWFPDIVPPVMNGLEFKVTLQTGEDLVIRTASALAVSRLGLPIGLGAGLLGTLVGLLALYLMLRESRPLADLAAAVDKINLVSDPAVLPNVRRRAPEVRAVTSAFSRLQSRMEGMLRARMALVGGFSHDVRTFATRLRLRVEAIPDATERARAIADIEDMIEMLDNALLSSKAGAGELTHELVDFSELVAQETGDRANAGAAVDLTPEPDGGDFLVLGDRLALRRIVSNLTDNALKYGHAAHLQLRLDEGTIRLIVEDEGSGIPQGLREEMLEPFSRLETSRNRSTGGAGLGLAIVRTLCEAHGGSVAIQDAESGGARLVARFPAFKT